MQPKHIPTHGFKLPYYLTYGFSVASFMASHGNLEQPSLTVADGTEVGQQFHGPYPRHCYPLHELDVEWVLAEVEHELKYEQREHAA